MKQPWLPNWKDASAYPDPDSTTPDQWAWEFLRRNPEYQQDFSVLTTFFDCDKGVFRPKKLAQYGYDDATRALASFCEKYGLEYAIFPPAPDRDFSRIGSLKASWGPAHVTYQDYFLGLGREQPALSPTKPGEVVIRVDLSLPISTTIERVSALMEDLRSYLRQRGDIQQDGDPRFRPDKYPIYLRLLDAESCAASLDDMASEIYPGKSNSYPEYQGRDAARKALQAAERYRDSDYRLIPFAKDRSTGK